MSERLSKRAKEIIERVIYITIASISDDGRPWNAPVFSAYDEDFSFYWGWRCWASGAMRRAKPRA